MTDGAVRQEIATQRLAWIALAAGALGLLISVFGALIDTVQFFQSYLIAYVFWLAIPLGSLAILMLHHLVGGAWGWAIRRLLEAATRTLPLIALLFVPMFFGLHALYPWARPELVAVDPLLQHKAAYMNVPFFIARAVFYLALWGGIAYFLNRWSRQQDDAAETAAGKRLRRLSGPGLLVYFLTMSFAAIDWMMSIDAHWYSTIYGVIWIVNQGLTGFAFAIVGLCWLEKKQPLAGLVRQDHFHDLGNLLLAFVMLWAYINFSQYLIIWSANITEEIPWYLARTTGAWQWIPPVLIVVHFVVPFFLLLMRDVKRNSGALLWVAAGILCMRLIDTFWLIAPGFLAEGELLHWLDIAVVVGIGGLWLATFLWQLNKLPLLPARERLLLEENTAHG